MIARLQSQLPNIQTLPFPVDPAELGRPVVAKQVYVGFKGKRSELPNGLMVHGRVPSQKQQLEFELVLRVQDLRTHQILYPVMEQIESAIIGYRPRLPPDNDWILTSGFYHTNSGFTDFAAGLWLYSMVFAINVVSVNRRREPLPF
jgi:hypothetical protein